MLPTEFPQEKVVFQQLYFERENYLRTEHVNKKIGTACISVACAVLNTAYQKPYPLSRLVLPLPKDGYANMLGDLPIIIRLIGHQTKPKYHIPC